MKSLLSKPALVVLILLAIAFALVSWAQSSKDDNNNDQTGNQKHAAMTDEKATKEQPATTEQSAETESTETQQPADTEMTQHATSGNGYSYTAQAGDSYTKIARKAVQTYGLIKGVNLSQAQIIAAETFLTKKAGSPELNLGQAVSVSESDVEAVVKQAQDLSEVSKMLWERYVVNVNFNTDRVGQVQ